MISRPQADSREILPAFVAVANAAVLALLGPEGHSSDSRLFGRRVFVVTGGSQNRG